MIPVDDFIKKAKEQGIDERVVNEYISTRKSENVATSQPNFSLSYVPQGYNPNISYIPEPNSNSGNAQLVSSKGVPITQQFGNYNPALYRGINKSMRNTGVDFGYKEGTPISVPDGEWQVVEVGGGYNRGYGNSVLVQNAQTGEKLRFSHLSKMAPLKRGQKLNSGVVFALTGATGNVTGPHLDLEYVNQKGQLANVLNSPYGGNY